MRFSWRLLPLGIGLVAAFLWAGGCSSFTAEDSVPGGGDSAVDQDGPVQDGQPAPLDGESQADATPGDAMPDRLVADPRPFAMCSMCIGVGPECCVGAEDVRCTLVESNCTASEFPQACTARSCSGGKLCCLTRDPFGAAHSTSCQNVCPLADTVCKVPGDCSNGACSPETVGGLALPYATCH